MDDFITFRQLCFYSIILGFIQSWCRLTNSFSYRLPSFELGRVGRLRRFMRHRYFDQNSEDHAAGSQRRGKMSCPPGVDRIQLTYAGFWFMVLSCGEFFQWWGFQKTRNWPPIRWSFSHFLLCQWSFERTFFGFFQTVTTEKSATEFTILIPKDKNIQWIISHNLGTHIPPPISNMRWAMTFHLLLWSAWGVP